MSADLADRVREAVAGGFRGGPRELAPVLGVEVEALLTILEWRGRAWVLSTRPVIGRRFGDWTVQAIAPMRRGQTRWAVRCVCGRTGERYAADITSGRSTRCGRCPRVQALLAIRRVARSGRCEVCGAAPTRPCVDAGPAAFAWGVHEARALASGAPPMPGVGTLNVDGDALLERVAKARTT